MTNFLFEEAYWLTPFGLSVWHEFTGLAKVYKAINLGQGFPNFSPPGFLLDITHTAIDSSALTHQYARPGGHLRLVKALAALYSPLVGRQLNPETQFQITAGDLSFQLQRVRS
eukprot:TRINITY_DN8431_c0_g1_i1.p1 TRINITY_DN8431_c0_g1~~TRINITY_DN8431_c0_g1_i1.p1  ORF type:complete len:113 (+),score=11.85 TRINITY_DN8431_c0_g1_i1:26-364(+)